MALNLMKKIKLQFFPKGSVLFTENKNDGDGRFYVILQGKCSMKKVYEK